MKKRDISSGSKKVPKNPADDKPDEPKFLRPSPFNGVSLPVANVWKPGQSGNPGGHPKGKRVSTWLAEFGEMPVEDWPEAGTTAHKRLPGNARIALSQLRKALREPDDLDPKKDSVGLAAAAWAADRVEGGVDRTVHLTHKQEATMTPEQVAQELKNAGLTGPADVPKLEEF